MATFESIIGGVGHSKKESASTIEKYPYRRVKPAIERFTKVFEIDLGRLQRHQINISKFQALQDWSGLKKEQINAQRTIQQLKSTLKQLEQTMMHIDKEDIPKFESQLNGIHQQCIEAVMEFVNSHEQIYHSLEKEDEVQSGLKQSESTGKYEDQGHDIDETDVNDAELKQMQIASQHLNERPMQESWEKLKDDLVDLNGMINVFYQHVHEQQEPVDSIEENVETAQSNIQEGVLSLATAANLKAAVFPVAGAVVGGLLGGPIGLFAGIKVGAVAAVGGGLAGFTGGKLLKNHQENQTGTEMQDLSKRNSDIVDKSDPDSNQNDDVIHVT